MNQIFLVSIAAVALLAPGPSLKAAQPFAGRWDLTVTTPKDTYPSWMEFTQSGAQPQVRVVGRVASVHPAADVKLDGSHLSFTTSEWFDGEIKVTWEFHAAGGKLTHITQHTFNTIATAMASCQRYRTKTAVIIAAILHL